MCRCRRRPGRRSEWTKVSSGCGAGVGCIWDESECVQLREACLPCCWSNRVTQFGVALGPAPDALLRSSWAAGHNPGRLQWSSCTVPLCPTCMPGPLTPAANTSTFRRLMCSHPHHHFPLASRSSPPNRHAPTRSRPPPPALTYGSVDQRVPEARPEHGAQRHELVRLRHLCHHVLPREDAHVEVVRPNLRSGRCRSAGAQRRTGAGAHVSTPCTAFPQAGILPPRTSRSCAAYAARRCPGRTAARRRPSWSPTTPSFGPARPSGSQRLPASWSHPCVPVHAQPPPTPQPNRPSPRIRAHQQLLPPVLVDVAEGHGADVVAGDGPQLLAAVGGKALRPGHRTAGQAGRRSGGLLRAQQGQPGRGPFPKGRAVSAYKTPGTTAGRRVMDLPQTD